MKRTIHQRCQLAAKLLRAATLGGLQAATASVLFTDNFNVVSGNSQNLNQDLAVRQAGPFALATYTGSGSQHQVGNGGTDVGQPGGAPNSGYILLAFSSGMQSDLNIAAVSAGPLTIDVDMYNNGVNPGGGGSGSWVACSLRAAGTAYPVAGTGEFGFLKRAAGGVQVFQGGSAIGSVSSWDTAGFATADHWTIIFTDTAGTGSAFVGNGSKVTLINGTKTLGTITLSQLNRSGLKLGFYQDSNRFAGIDNLAISGTLPAVAVTTSNQNGSNPFTPTWTAEVPSLIAGQAPTTAAGNFGLEASGGTPVLTDGAIGTSGTIAGFATCGGGSGSGSTLVYTLTNSVNGCDVTNIVVYSGWGDTGRDGQYYDLSYSTVSAPTTYIPITTVYYLPGVGNAPANRVAIAMRDGTPLASAVGNIKFSFSGPPGASGFNNGYQGYSEIIVQGTNTAAPAPPPSPYLVQDTLPDYIQTVVGDTAVFTASFSNTPPTALQWQHISGGVTNDVPGATLETLTLTNLQVTDTGSYILKAVNATNGAAAPSYTTARTLTVGATPAAVNNVIAKYAAQTFPKSSGFFPPWVVDSANLNLIAGFTPGSGPGTFVQVGDFSGGGGCNPDTSILVDGLASSITSVPNLSFCGGGTHISSAGESITYSFANASGFGLDLTNITVFGGWQDAGRDEQKYQVLYSTVQAPASFVPLLMVDYDPGNPNNAGEPAVTRTTLVPAAGVLAHNVAALQINFNVSPGPKNGWEGYSEILVGGQPSTGFVPTLTNDIAPSVASDMAGGQVILTAGFSGATTLQWKKDGVNLPGANATTLILNNIQANDAGAYMLVASNSIGGNQSSACAVTVNPAPVATNNIVIAIATQTSVAQLFTPTWDTNALSSSLLYNSQPFAAGDGDFTGGNFGTSPTGGSPPGVLTDGTFGTINFNVTGLHSWVTCIGSGTGANNDQGGNYVTYALPASANGYDITNIMTAGGWNDAGRDQQSYTVSYATAANPTFFIPLAVVSYNPVTPVGYSMSRATITPASGVLAANVVALQFDMTTPAGENGFSGYSEIAAYGSPSANPPPAGLVITAEHQEDNTSWVAETPNLIAGQLPSSQGAGVFTGEGCNVTNLTDGVLGFGAAFGAACGTDPTVSVPWLVFSAPTGWDLTNIVVYTMWHDYGRDGQFYTLSYSTVSAPTTFLPLANVNINPPMPHDGRASGLRVGIAPAPGQSMIASNVAAVKFDFTQQGTQDYNWCGYTEIVLQGANLNIPTPPTVTFAGASGGNLIVTGTGGTPNSGYSWLTSTNVSLPLSSWTVQATGTLDASGAFSNAIPINAAQPASFFKLRMP